MKIESLLGDSHSVQISEVIRETPLVRTLRFSYENRMSILPGQFFMIWIPGIDEIPMSISAQDESSLSITVLPLGEATQKLCSLTAGDWIGIRGPFGSSFDMTSKKVLVIGGGVGMAPLRPLVYTLLKQNTEVTLLIAAKTKDELVFFNEYSGISSSKFSLELSTDDGSLGYKGLATEAAKVLLQENEYDMLYTCGPELMMAGLYRLSQEFKTPVQASLERFMKCGCGICGTCAMDPTGHLVCVDGPVFRGEQLANFNDFGRYYRDAVGIKKKY